MFPSKYEGLGIAFIEAQVVGIKCLASDSIPKDAFISPKAFKLSLEDSISKWADYILDESLARVPDSDMELFDMRNVIYKLESIYSC